MTDKKTSRVVAFRIGNKRNDMVYGKIETGNYVDVRDVHRDYYKTDETIGGVPN
jgi:hypothetical protein